MTKSLSRFPLVLLSLTALFVVACSDDEGPVTFSKAAIQGKWLSLTEVSSGCQNTDDNETITYSCPDHCLSLTFNDDDTYDLLSKEDGSTFEFTGTYTVEENVLTNYKSGVYDEYDASIVNDQLILIYENNGCTTTLTFKRG